MYLSGVVIVVIVVVVLWWVGSAKRGVATSMAVGVTQIEHEISQLVQSLCVEAARYRIALRANGIEPPTDESLVLFAEQRLRRIGTLSGMPVHTGASESVLDLVCENWFEDDLELERWINASSNESATSTMSSPAIETTASTTAAPPLHHERLPPARNTAVPVQPETEKTVRERGARQAYAAAVKLKEAGHIEQAIKAYRQVSTDFPETVAGDLAFREMQVVATAHGIPLDLKLRR